jgi:WD40 repeat protein
MLHCVQRAEHHDADAHPGDDDENDDCYHDHHPISTPTADAQYRASCPGARISDKSFLKVRRVGRGQPIASLACSSQTGRANFVVMARLRTPVGIGIAIAMSACSGGAADVADDQPAPTATSAGLEQIAVIGLGRATQVSSTGTGGALVATTVGVELLASDGTTTAVPTDLLAPVTGVAVTADSTHGMVAGLGATELWSLAATPTLIAELPETRSAAFTAEGASLVVSTPAELTVVPVTAPDEVRVLTAAPAGSELGAATMSSDASVIAAPVAGSGVDLVVHTDAGGASFVDVDGDPATRVDRASVTRDGTRTVMTLSAPDPFAGRLASWNVAESSLEWEMDIGPSGLTTMWAVGSDGRTMLSDENGRRLVGTDGVLAAEWPHEGDAAPIGLVATAQGYVFAHADGSLSFTDLDGTPTSRSAGSGRPIVDLRPLADEDGVSVVDTAGTVTSWRSDADLITESGDFRSGSINDVAVSPDGTLIGFGSTAGVATVAAVDGSSPPNVMNHAEGNVDSVSFAADGTELLTGVSERISDEVFDDTVSTWDIDQNVRTATFGGEAEHAHGYTNFRSTVRYSPDGDLFAATSHDFSISLYRTETAELVTKLAPHANSVLDIAFSPDGDRLVSSSEDGIVRVWNVADAAVESEYAAAAGGYWSLAFTPDGESMVANDVSGTLRLVDVSTGTEIRVFDGSTLRSSRVSVSPDGSLVASAADGNAIGLWSTASGQQLSRVEGHAAPITATAFSPDGGVLVTGSSDGTVRAWSVV